GFQPSLDASAGRERDAAGREKLERADADRLGDEWKRAKDRVSQLDARRQALSARQRQMAAIEVRLLAMGERIDAGERQVRTRAERLDAWSRRLDARAERLELLERRTGEQKKTGEGPKAGAPTAAGADTKAAKEKAVFVMVVKAPTAIMKEQAPGTAPTTGAAAAQASGVAVEKAVAAATVVAFPTTTSELSELDRESIENIAKLAARENCELLVWARAKSPALLAEAQRRADDIKKRAVAAGPVDAKRIVTRVTTRPGATGVDVVVSALRETGAKPSQPAAPTGAQPTGQGAVQSLVSGETGKRQIRDAVLRAQPAIETCVGEQIQRKNLTRAEGVLKLTVAANGKVVVVKTSDGDLAGPELESCLTEAAKTWQFPSAEGEYVVDVPITVIGGGAAK
ncbi:MAG: AgmX/PglI C-terminal domain-containing protein, partial [Anaeromyxobacteraceae bacterium]